MREATGELHNAIHEVEHENVGVEAGHKTEQAVEELGGAAGRRIKRSIRSHKLKPYRAAAAAEKKAAKANADFLYQKALHDNPAPVSYTHLLSHYEY